MNSTKAILVAAVMLVAPLSGCLGGGGYGGGGGPGGSSGGGGGGQGAAINKVVVTYESSDPTPGINSLKAGSADRAYVPYDKLSDFQNNPKFKVLTPPTFDETLLLLQNQPTASGSSNGTTSATCGGKTYTSRQVMSDPAVRRALSYLVDYKTIQKNVYQGYMVPLPGPIPKGFSYYDTQNNGTSPFHYDPQKAAAILSQAGYKKDANGYYFCGLPLRTFYNSGNAQRQQTMQLFAQDLQKAGIKASVKSLEWSQYLTRMFNTHDWDIMALGWAPDYLDPSDYWDPFVGYSCCGGSADTWNTGYNNTHVQKLVHQAARTTDHTKRAQLYTEAYQAYLKDPNLIFVGQPTGQTVIQNHFTRYKPNPLQEPYFAYYRKDPSTSQPHTFQYVEPSGYKWLDPADAYDTASDELISNVYDTLVTYPGHGLNGTDHVVPDLATGWYSSDNGSTWTFNLTHNATFYDPYAKKTYNFTSADVAYYFQRALKLNGPQSGVMWMITQYLNRSTPQKDVQANGPYQVTFHLNESAPAWPKILAYQVGAITSKKVCEQHGGMPTLSGNGTVKDKGCDQWLGSHMVGTGPYYLVPGSNQQGNGGGYTLQANPDYHRGNGSS